MNVLVGTLVPVVLVAVGTGVFTMVIAALAVTGESRMSLQKPY